MKLRWFGHEVRQQEQEVIKRVWRKTENQVRAKSGGRYEELGD